MDPPTIIYVGNLATTQVLMRLTPVANANSYEIRLSADGGKTWLSGGVVSQARAIGGSTGQSDWSTPVTIMAT